MRGMHVIFIGINVNGTQIREIEHYHVQKKIKMAFEIALPVNNTKFLKTTITKKSLFFDSVSSKNGNWHKQNKCVL